MTTRRIDSELVAINAVNARGHNNVMYRSIVVNRPDSLDGRFHDPSTYNNVHANAVSSVAPAMHNSADPPSLQVKNAPYFLTMAGGINLPGDEYSAGHAHREFQQITARVQSVVPCHQWCVTAAKNGSLKRRRNCCVLCGGL